MITLLRRIIKILDFENYLTSHFQLKEFISPCDRDLFLCVGEGSFYLKNLKIIALKLERVRKVFKVPIIINSGFRSEEHNRDVGGRKNSYHLYGMAVDISYQGISLKDRGILGKEFKGLIYYESLKFWHCDIRSMVYFELVR